MMLIVAELSQKALNLLYALRFICFFTAVRMPFQIGNDKDDAVNHRHLCGSGA